MSEICFKIFLLGTGGCGRWRNDSPKMSMFSSSEPWKGTLLQDGDIILGNLVWPKDVSTLVLPHQGEAEGSESWEKAVS